MVVLPAMFTMLIARVYKCISHVDDKGVPMCAWDVCHGEVCACGEEVMMAVLSIPAMDEELRGGMCVCAGM